MNCSADQILRTQFAHGGELALAILMFGASAALLDRYAAHLRRRGASPWTVRLIHLSAGCLVATDLGVCILLTAVRAAEVCRACGLFP